MPATVRIPDDLKTELDAQRGLVPREAFARSMIELGLKTLHEVSTAALDAVVAQGEARTVPTPDPPKKKPSLSDTWRR